MAHAKNGVKMTIDIGKERELLPRGTRLLCAVSGGADSMCLLHLMKSRAAELGCKRIAAAHNHDHNAETLLLDIASVASR